MKPHRLTACAVLSALAAGIAFFDDQPETSSPQCTWGLEGDCVMNAQCTLMSGQIVCTKCWLLSDGAIPAGWHDEGGDSKCRCVSRQKSWVQDATTTICQNIGGYWSVTQQKCYAMEIPSATTLDQCNTDGGSWFNGKCYASGCNWNWNW